MLKKFLVISTIILLLIGMTTIVHASETATATTTINGVAVNWEYKINSEGKIEDLKCTNPTDLTGSITIPSTIDGKSVVKIGRDAFKAAVNITGVTIPDSVDNIYDNAFEGCSNLSEVDLGSIATIGANVFKDCPKLKTITIPKTLKTGPYSSWGTYNGPFSGTTKLTSVTLEEGMTNVAHRLLQGCTEITSITIPNTVTTIEGYAFAKTGITSITIPDSVEKISYNAFEACSNLSEVDLGSITMIDANVFKDCPELKTITIPKTLKTGPYSSWGTYNGPFSGTTKLTSVTLEEGMTNVAHRILQDCTEITSITIPNTVEKIECYAFKNTGIKEISIPKSVQRISYDAFDDCADLEKITILDSVKYIGNSEDEETVFKNHNENLTIYCYKDSVAANYAIKHNIKYVYITEESTKPTSGITTIETTTKTDTTNNSNKSVATTDANKTSNDTTTAKTSIPQTGETEITLCIILVVLIVGTLVYVRYRKIKNI